MERLVLRVADGSSLRRGCDHQSDTRSAWRGNYMWVWLLQHYNTACRLKSEHNGIIRQNMEGAMTSYIIVWLL